MPEHERRHGRRKGSSDSTRSSRSHRSGRSRSRDDYEPRRRGSGDSVSSHRSRRERDRYHRDSRDRMGSVREEVEEEDVPERQAEQRPSRQNSKDSIMSKKAEADLPSYALSEARDAPEKGSTGTAATTTVDTVEAGESDKSDKTPGSTDGMSVISRICWSMALILPLLAGVVMLFLITCSSSELRADFSVIKVRLTPDSFDALFAATEHGVSEDGNSTSILSQASTLGGIIRRAESTNGSEAAGHAGFLTLGAWGWCVRSQDAQKSTCSVASSWYSMDKVLASKPGGMEPDDFNSLLVHAMILHGIALLCAMLAFVPVLLHLWRRYYRANRQAEAGWFQHGTILAAAVVSMGAWIVDKFFLGTLSGNLGKDQVLAGPALTLIGISSLVLISAFLISALPVLYRFGKHKRQYILSGRQLTTASAEVVREQEEKEQAARDAEAERQRIRDEEKRRRRERSKRAKGKGNWRNRMTRMFRSDEYSDSEDDDRGYSHSRRRGRR